MSKLDKLDDSLSTVNIDFKILYEESVKKILSKISTDYELEYEQLVKKYLTNNDNNVSNNIKKKKKKINEIADSNRCIANTAKYTRCTKSKLPGIQFCGFHRSKQQYGIVKTEKEVMVIENCEYIVDDNKLYLKEYISDKLENEDFSFSSIHCDGIIEKDGSVSLY